MCAERAVVFQVTQIAKEDTYGTNVAANKALQSVGIEPAIKSAVQTFKPRGWKTATLAALGKEWVEAKISGYAAYNDMHYLLAALLTSGAITQQGATIAYKTEFSLIPSAPDTPVSYSVEVGDTSTWSSGVIAHEFSGGILTDLALDFSRDAIKVDGAMLGKGFANLGATMTAATPLALQPVLPTEYSVYMADTYAGLPGSALTRLMSASWKISGKYGPLWALNAATTGFVAPIEKEPTMTMSVKLLADAVGMGLLTQLRSGASKFMRFEAVGPIIATTYHYTLTIDMCGKVTDPGPLQDMDGAYGIEWTLTGAYDPTWGKSLLITLTDVISAL
jgi:hypothetical protein